MVLYTIYIKIKWNRGVFMIWIIVIGLGIWIAYSVSVSSKSNLQTEGVVESDIFSVLISGFPDTEGGKKVHFKIYEDKIRLEFTGINFKEIPMNKIINAEIMSNQQIESGVNLGSILIYGIFAIGKTKSIVKNYSVITYDDNGVNRSIIIESSNNEKMVRKIREIKFGV
jgi:hypothetical protein